VIIRPVFAVVERDLVKLFRQKGRLLSALVRPLIWLFVIGAGFDVLIEPKESGYRSFLIPGVLGMAVLFGALLGALSTVYEKESGVMKIMIIAPLKHYWIVFAKMTSASISACVQVVLLLIVLALLGDIDRNLNWLLLGFSIILLSLACSGIGMLVAAFSKTLDNFAAIMNFVIFPVFFLSGSLYPVSNLPGLLGILAKLNPYTYGVDLLKHSVNVPSGGDADFTIVQNVSIILLFTATAFVVSSWRFSRDEASDVWFVASKKK
tara:strand:+ start:2817 stop:3608 length:792 start_codon:yes stop_codon:yes gene_type:complete